MLQGAAVSPFRARSRSASPSQLTSRQGSPARHGSPHRAASTRSQQLPQQPSRQLPQQPLPSAGTAAMSGWQRKLQEDFDRYKRIGQQGMTATGRPIMPMSGRQPMSGTGRQDMSSPANQKPAALRQQSIAGDAQANPRGTSQLHDRGIGILGRRLQASQSMDRRRRLVHQQTTDVVPRLDSLGYGSPSKQPAATVRGEGVSGRSGSIRASAPPWSGVPSARRLSPSRFAEREQEPLLASGFGRSQRIGALH